MTDRDRQEFFRPLPPSNFNRDELLQWLATQTISAQKLISGEIQVGIEISSQNFVSGSAGWQIDGDGNAEFNDITVRGDIISSNWDGAEPASIPDLSATQGYYLDSSAGAAQFSGPVWLEDNLRIVDAATNVGLSLSADNVDGYLETLSRGLLIRADSGETLRLGVGTTNYITLQSTRVNLGQQLDAISGTASAPGITFGGDSDTGLYLVQSNFIGISTGGTQRFQIGSEVAIVTPGTTGSSANLTVAGSGLNNIRRSTSSLKYKPDWQWARDAADLMLPTPIRWTDERGQVRLGFGAEHVWGAVPEAYENEVYDLRSLVAILSEKVKRLEATVGVA